MAGEGNCFWEFFLKTGIFPEFDRGNMRDRDRYPSSRLKFTDHTHQGV
jgi:hypothetical protein